MSKRAPLPRIRLLAIVALVAGLVGGSAAAPAFAHDELLASDPAPDATVGALPEQITMTFSGVLIDEPGVNAVSVTDAAGTELAEGAPVLDGTEVTQALAGDSQGPIEVTWRVVSSDGHPVSGQFSFIAGDVDAAPDPGSPSGEPVVDSADEGLSPALWIGVGVVVLVGVAAVVIAVVATSRRRTED